MKMLQSVSETNMWQTICWEKLYGTRLWGTTSIQFRMPFIHHCY